MTTSIRIALAQYNFLLGDIQGNTKKIICAVQQAQQQGADIIVFPELTLSGYPPQDLVFRKDFSQQITAALTKIQYEVPNLVVIVGVPQQTSQGIYNAATVFYQQKCLITARKQILPNYGVFDEKRNFIAGSETQVFIYKDIRFALLICEDLWQPQPIAKAKQAQADVVLSINASPFDCSKLDERKAMLQQRFTEQQLPIIYTALIGGQDDLIFDGSSLVLDATGNFLWQGKFCEEELALIEVRRDKNLQIITPPSSNSLSSEAQIYQALVLSVRDYVEKNNFPSVLIGVSGGIDSALVAAIAVDALGKDRVKAVVLPSRFTSQLSLDLAGDLIQRLGIARIDISIEAIFEAHLQNLLPVFTGFKRDKTEENLQARCRGTLLMALSNKWGSLVLTTGNKSEMAVGYATLYGDMAGGFAVLKDVSKTLVYRLANYRNSLQEIIPIPIITRAPTAELALNQKDEDSLPPYDILDAIIEMYVEKDLSYAEIVQAGFEAAVVKQVIQLIHYSEYKRQQAPLGPKITRRAFSRERRYPVTSGFMLEKF